MSPREARSRTPFKKLARCSGVGGLCCAVQWVKTFRLITILQINQKKNDSTDRVTSS
jgi:hypothetical protein